MHHTVFQLATVTRALADDVQLAEVITIPEVSALGDAEHRILPALETKARAVLEDCELSPALSLHRRQIVIEPVTDEFELRLDPPKRMPAWQEPVSIRVPIVRWAEEGQPCCAFVPALGIQVFAPDDATLNERIQSHARLALLGRRRKVALRELAQLARVQSLTLGHLEVTARRPTPRQAAEKDGREKGEKSVLNSVCEELLPRVPHTDSAANPAAREPVAPAAFEMEAELRNLAEALSGDQPQSVLLVGASGCGKTALVSELARRRREFGFSQTPFWSTSGARLMTGQIGFGMWQERCQNLCREISKSRAILHVRNLGEVLEVGKAERGQQSVGSFLQPWIARGEILVITECAPEQLAVIERNDPHLLSAFLQIRVAERTSEQTRAILARVFEMAPGKAPVNRVAEVEGAIDRLHLLHRRYAHYSANPARAIRFLKNLLADRFPEKTLSEAEVTRAFSRETGLPGVLLDDDAKLDLAQTREWFSTWVIGQTKAIDHVVNLLAMIKARLARPGKPLASFLFVGQTGTGKTELAKSLAQFLFGDSNRMARFDLNQFNDPVSMQRLVGGPLAGSAEGLLTARVREQPFSVVLLDELEKADPGFFDLLLQILGDGRLTDAAGRVADFCNCVIVMTSNLGTQSYQSGPSGFQSSRAEGAQEHFTEAVRKFLRPEIFNRLDAVVPFQPLSPEVVLNIARRQIGLLEQRDGLRLRPIEFRVLPEVAEYLAGKGYDPRYGARPLKRVIERELLVPLSEALTRYDDSLRLSLQVGVRQNRIEIGVTPRAKKDELLKDESVRAIIAQRRLVSRLKNSTAVSAIENQLAMAESLERRLAGAKWKSPEQQARLARLPMFRRCLDAVGQLYERACRLETDVLSAFYGQERAGTVTSTELKPIDAERLRLMREVFRLQLEEPDDIVFALFSEHRALLLKMALCYQSLAQETGRVVALDYILPPEGGRAKASTSIRRDPVKPGEFFKDVPEKILGVVMHLKGDLFYGRFQNEAGLHVLKETVEEFCLIETGRIPFEKYHPPQGIDRPGGISPRKTNVRRSFDRTTDTVDDSYFGERPWKRGDFEVCIKTLIDERLDKTIEAVIRP